MNYMKNKLRRNIKVRVITSRQQFSRTHADEITEVIDYGVYIILEMYSLCIVYVQSEYSLYIVRIESEYSPVSESSTFWCQKGAKLQGFIFLREKGIHIWCQWVLNYKNLYLCAGEKRCLLFSVLRYLLHKLLGNTFLMVHKLWRKFSFFCVRERRTSGFGVRG